MTTRIAFLVRLPQFFPILLCVICLLSPAVAQHGGGGGDSGGGHASGGRSSSKQRGGGHAGGHFGWLHFRSRRNSARHAGFEASSTSDTSPHPPSHLWNPTLARMPSIPRIPSTLLWSPPLFPRRPDGNVSCAIQSLFRFDVVSGSVKQLPWSLPHHKCFLCLRNALGVWS